MPNISDQPKDVKPEPVFIGPENISGPDPVDFSPYCLVSDNAVYFKIFKLSSKSVIFDNSFYNYIDVSQNEYVYIDIFCTCYYLM